MCLFALLLCALLLTGCWSSRELSELAIVVGVALDAGESAETVVVTVQIAKAAEMKAGTGSSERSGGSSKANAYLNVQYEAESVSDAVREMSRMLSRKPYFPHNEVILIGRELAGQGVSDELDMFMRDHESRMEMELLVVDGTAADALESTADMEPFPAHHIYESLNLQWANSKAMPMSVRKFSIDWLSPSGASMLPMMKLSYGATGEKQVMLSGMAVFSGDRMVGTLTPEESRGVLWVLGEAEDGTLLVDAPGGRVSLSMKSPKAVLKPSIQEDGSFAMSVSIECQAFVSDSKTRDDLTKLEVVEYVQASAATVIREEIEAALRHTKQMNTDVFGFGDTLNRAYFTTFRNVDWGEEFVKLPVKLDIKVAFISTGAITKPLIPGGEA